MTPSLRWSATKTKRTEASDRFDPVPLTSDTKEYRMNNTEHGLTHFYFALPLGASLANAQEHIAKTFGHDGAVERVRSELAFDLYRIEVSA